MNFLAKHHPQRQFPLLVKLLDAQQKLRSVQVHPNDEQAARLVPPDLVGKPKLGLCWPSNREAGFTPA